MTETTEAPKGGLLSKIKEGDMNWNVILGYRQLYNWAMIWIGAYYILFGQEPLPVAVGLLLVMIGLGWFFQQVYANVDMLEIQKNLETEDDSSP